MTPTEDSESVLLQHKRAAKLMLGGLATEYPKAIVSDRLTLWAAAAHAIIDWMALAKPYDEAPTVTESEPVRDYPRPP
jgi:hypothetical protein